MTPTEAAKLLDLPPDASPEQIEARFLELRAKIEERIAKAPTPGLKDKYRDSITDLTKAFEILTIASDSTALPVLQRQRTEDGGQKSGANTPAPPSAARPSPSSGGKSGKEYLVVGLIAVLVLGAGGWWMIKSNREAAEKARREAAAQAELERLAAENARRAEEEKTRAAAAAQAEQQRRDQLALQLRPRLAELTIALDAVLRSESTAERELADLKAEERVLFREAKGASTPDLRAAQALAQAHERYHAWLRDHLAATPARTARARLDELASAKAWEEVAAGIEAYAAAIAQLQTEIPARRKDLLTLTGALNLTAEPAEVDFVLRDTYGRTRSGRTPAELTDVPFGAATVTFSRPGWPAQERKVSVVRDQAAAAQADLVGGAVELATEPFPAEFTLSGQGREENGRTPAKFTELPVGDYSVTYRRKGWPDQNARLTVVRSGTARSGAKFTPPGSLRVTSQPEGAEVWMDGQVAGSTPLFLPELPPGPVKLELKRAEFRPVELGGAIESGKELALTATLRSATLSKEEAIEKFSRDAAGVWMTPDGGLGGGVNHYLKFTAGSAELQWRMDFMFSGKEKLKMIDYDAANNAIVVQWSSLGRLGAKMKVYLKDGALYQGAMELQSTRQLKYNRVPDTSW